MFSPPRMRGFKPFGTPTDETESITLLYEEYEAIRLADYLNYTQEEAAKQMNVSRSTFTRIYDKARKVIAEALSEGKIIEIEGGNVEFDNEWYKCNNCNETFKMQNQHLQEECIICNSENIEKVIQNTTIEKKKECHKKDKCLKCPYSKTDKICQAISCSLHSRKNLKIKTQKL